MTSPSREAFEAWVDARDATHGGKLRNAANDFDYPLGRLLDECWQAAIQHASDVAVKVCEKNKRINLGVDYPEDAGYNLAIRVCVDAIKKKLHSRAATLGNKGTTPNS